jgi:hypothetical protein
MEPNKDALRKWVAKLRDPNSKQMIGTLGIANGERCCLGVACDVAVENGIISAPTPREDSVLYYGSEEAVSVLPYEVSEWLGVEIDPILGYADSEEKIPQRATPLNDNHGWTFPMIADAIEEMYNLREKDTEK